MYSNATKKLIRELAEKHNITISEAEAICYSFPDFLYHIFKNVVDPKNSKFPIIKVKGWGTYYAPVIYKKYKKKES